MFGFLANLRDMKSSLTSGMIVLFTLWVIFGNGMADVQNDDSMAGNLRRLIEYIGPAGTLGIVTFVAYLVGLVLSLDQRVMKLFFRGSRHSTMPMSLTTSQRLDKKFGTALLGALRKARPDWVLGSISYFPGRLDPSVTHLSRSEAELRNLAEGSAMDEQIKAYLKDLMLEDMDILAVQLHSKHDKTYDKYDKAKTEADFRASLVIPLGALGLVVMNRLIAEGIWLWGVGVLLLAIVVALALLWKALQKQREANEEIINAVIVGDIEFAPLTILNEIEQEIRVPPREPGTPTISSNVELLSE